MSITVLKVCHSGRSEGLEVFKDYRFGSFEKIEEIFNSEILNVITPL